MRVIPCGVKKSPNSLIGFPLPYDITFQKRTTTIDALKRKKLGSLYNKFSFYRKLVKTTIKADRLTVC
jgi:hypothetical protein